MTKRGATVQHLSALTVTVKLVVNCAPCFVRVSSVWFIICAICLSFCSVPLLSTFLKTICGGMKRKRKLSSHLRNWNQKLFSDCIFFLKKISRYQKSVIELQLIYILPTPLSCSRKSTLCSDLWLITKNKRHRYTIRGFSVSDGVTAVQTAAPCSVHYCAFISYTLVQALCTRGLLQIPSHCASVCSSLSSLEVSSRLLHILVCFPLNEAVEREGPSNPKRCVH